MYVYIWDKLIRLKYIYKNSLINLILYVFQYVRKFLQLCNLARYFWKSYNISLALIFVKPYMCSSSTAKHFTKGIKNQVQGLLEIFITVPNF